MFLKGKTLDEYKGFSYRLVQAAINKDIIETRDLADALYSNTECSNIISIRKKQKTKSEDPLKNIMKNIQIHLNTEDVYEVNSRYIYAYSIVLGCSFDYLYGKTEIKSADLKIRAICDKTGLTEDAVINLVETHQNEIESGGFSCIEWWSELLHGMPFHDIPFQWWKYANRIVEINDIDKKIEACERASKEVPMEDRILKYLWDGDNQKTLRLVRKDKEDSILGAQYKLFSRVERYLEKYAEEWAEMQHPDFDEMYYHSEINKRNIMNAALKQQ